MVGCIEGLAVVNATGQIYVSVPVVEGLGSIDTTILVLCMKVCEQHENPETSTGAATLQRRFVASTFPSAAYRARHMGWCFMLML
jgi:hypothetical protein